MEVKEGRDNCDVNGFLLDQIGRGANTEKEHIGRWTGKEERFSCGFGHVDLGVLKVMQVTITRKMLLYKFCAQKREVGWRKTCEGEEGGRESR